MFTIRRANDRGHANHGWLDSYHTFSFADYHDPRFMGFRALRVINEDRVSPAKGFGTHGHRDMEIISYVLDGELAHKDSMGTGSTIVPGDVQRMSAGTGVRHSEFNASSEKPVHFLQIWIQPDKTSQPPSYAQKRFSADDKKAQLRLLASPGGEAGSIDLGADAKLYATLLDSGSKVTHVAQAGRHTWVHVAKGAAHVAGIALAAGDAAFTSDPGAIVLEGAEGGGELLVFDLA